MHDDHTSTHGTNHEGIFNASEFGCITNTIIASFIVERDIFSPSLISITCSRLKLSDQSLRIIVPTCTPRHF